MSTAPASAGPTRRTLVVAAWTTMMLTACGPVAAPPSPVPTGPPRAPSTDTRDLSPEALLELVRAREDRVSTLRARFTVRIRTGEGTERTLDGVVIVARPDAFRMSLISPLGLSVFDHVASGDSARTRYPMGPPRTDPSAGAGDATKAPFSHDEMAEVFLRGEHAYPGHCRPDTVGKDTVDFRCVATGDAHYRIIVIDRTAGRILAEHSFREGREQLRVTLDDHRTIDGVELPWRITMSSPDRAGNTEITVRSYEINPVLAAHLFAVEPRRERP